MMRYFVEIEKKDDRYRGAIHTGVRQMAKPLAKLNLEPDTKIHIREQSYRLGNLAEALITYQPDDLKIAYEERGQLEIGRYLYQQLFGDIQPIELKSEPNEQVELRIVTTDEHIARLPWVLLAHQALFLATADWSISLAQRVSLTHCVLLPSPKMLIVAPEPKNMAKTKAKAHIETLEYRLSIYDHRLALNDRLRVVRTWEQFCQAVERFQPDIVYYYGHGVGDRYHSRLVFETGEQQWRIDKPISDFAQHLRTMEEPPKIVYLNCCSGDAGGFLGAGWQLGEFIPAVITNRTIAYVDAAQAQALALWKSILLDGLPPHVAMTQIRSELVSLGLSFRDARWLTPIIHCHYGHWQANPPARTNPLEHDPHWHLKLDRVAQFGTVAFQTREMLRERRPRTLAYVWYGQKGQGIDLFHKRLNVELRNDLPAQAQFIEIQPEWPMELFDPERSFSDMMCEAFGVSLLEDIPSRIRAYTRGAAGRQTLVYVRHQPIRSKKIMNPISLKLYLKWWDEAFAPLLNNRIYALLTVSFEVKNPINFYRALLERERLYDLELERTVLRILDEMERIGMKDLFDFLQTHNIRLPRAHKDRILQEILAQTKGHYEFTVNALQRLVNRALDTDEEREPTQDETEDVFDY